MFQETFLTADKASKVKKQYSLNGWQNDFGYDKSSTHFAPNSNPDKFEELVILYNDTAKSSTEVSSPYCITN